MPRRLLIARLVFVASASLFGCARSEDAENSTVIELNTDESADWPVAVDNAENRDIGRGCEDNCDSSAN